MERQQEFGDDDTPESASEQEGPAWKSGPSPFQGEPESDTLITVRLPQGLFFALFVVPDSDYRNYQPAFAQMLDSVRFR